MTEPEVYEAAFPHRVRLLRWPDATAGDLARLIGPENVNELPTLVQVRNSDGEWTTLGDGWVVGLRDDGSRVILSPAALKAGYRKA